MSEYSKLVWQCRRGTLELDILLTRYLESLYEKADKAEQLEFVKLLTLEDSELLPYLMGDREPNSKKLLNLVDKIRNLSITVSVV